MNEPDASPRTPPVAITGTGVCAATGDLGAALWAATAARMCCGRPVAGLSVPDGDDGTAQPYAAPISGLPPEITAPVRLPIMAGQALTRACAFLPADRTGLQLLILTLLPGASPQCPEDSPDQPELAQALRDAHPALAMAQLRFAPADAGAAAQLAVCMDELHQGQWDAVLFGGVDSLTDHQTVRGLAARERCRTDRNPEATLPGEGAAYILLEKPDKDHPSMALITGSGQALEEHHGKAADRPMTGLAAAIEQALEQGQCPPARVESIVLPMGNDVPAALEWHQVRRRLWADPEESHGEMEELAPQSTIGETSAAALPLALAIGCARFEFDFPPVDRMLVCEAGRGSTRGAVLIERKPSAATPSPATKGETP